MTEKYTHSTYGVARAIFKNPDGTTREGTPEELEELRKKYEPSLRRSFITCTDEQWETYMRHRKEEAERGGP